ncbi:L,D-transpeptidase family protein [Pseudooceanicola sp. CBS1P-1]|uniref:L,D-transpeptidase family protein n=1 Tax=Pseudooceanicola albus TaxID=2692189 RepID=A0A6L7GBD9_9RHOB|nr:MULTISPECIES: L,D-transpeptidase family protein [Pseudooceanicola]MBT9386701.1 L,D-transpeptidase family protein [Pseudooceanicola endophyticus]MXN20887.1 L,D-transpeptidase family protein [Pseudooceanicola albus]
MPLRLTPLGLFLGTRHYPCAIGRGGISEDKREGDGATPRSLLSVEATLYRPDRMARPAPWARPIRPGDLWCDAPEDPAYNCPVRAPCPVSHEVMRRADPLYDLVIVLDWNRRPPLPHRGSAIFLHQWRRPHYPTAGCLALPRAELHALAAILRPGTQIRVV